MFPNDLNGRVLQQMYEDGDSLTQSRIVDFNFLFDERASAIRFIEEVCDQTVEACLSWCADESMWQVIVKIKLVPTYSEITTTEARLIESAEKFDGSDDGWGCFNIEDRG